MHMHLSETKKEVEDGVQTFNYQVNSMTNTNGRFGIHGGQYIPETLMNAVIELEEAYNHYKENDNCKFSTFLTLPKDWSVQLSGEYESPFWDLQTKMYGHYWFDMAVKKDLWQKRASINIRLGDIFCTGGWGHETYNEQMNRVMHSRRLSPMLTIGFTYKINNGLKQTRKMDAMEDGEGGGED